MRKARVVLLLVIIFVLSQTRMSVHGVPVSAAVLHMHGPVETATTMRWMKLSLSPSFSLLFKLFCASLCYPYEHRTDFSSDLRDDSRTDMKRVIICLHLSL